MITLAERRRVERFAALVEGTGGVGITTSERAPLELTRTLQRVPVNGDIDPEFRARLRTRLVAMSAVRLPAQVGTADTAARPAEVPRRPRRSRRIHVLGGLTACVLSMSGIGAASTSAVPGDALYGIKLATESTQVKLAGSDADRGRRYFTIARTRLGEARQVSDDEAALLDTLTAMDLATRKGTRLLTGVAARDQDREPLETIDTFVAEQGAALGSLLPSLAGGKVRSRVAESLLLVDRLRARSVALLATMLCPAAVEPADDLGPRPASCDADPALNTGPLPGIAGAAPGSGLLDRDPNGSPGPASSNTVAAPAPKPSSGPLGAGSGLGIKPPALPSVGAAGNAAAGTKSDIIRQLRGVPGLPQLPIPPPTGNPTPPLPGGR